MRTPFKLKSGNKTSFKDMGATRKDSWNVSSIRPVKAGMAWGGELPEVTVQDQKTSKAEVAETVVSSNRLARLKIDIDDMIDMEEEYKKKKKKKNKQSV